MIHLDTSFLIDLEREIARDTPGPAFEFLESLDEREVLAISVHVACELRLGAELSRRSVAAHEHLDRLLSGLLICLPDDRFVPRCAQVAAAVRRGSGVAHSMDLLIATAALLDDAPLVTRNVKDFSRVPGLRLITY